MARLSLKQILDAQGGLRPVIESIARRIGEPLAIEDAAGAPLFGTSSGGSRFAVSHGGKELGWVSGEAGSETIAELLRYMAAKESERKALGTEVLNLYREVNLIYSFSEKLAALLDLKRVAQLTLQEARHLIVATDGALLLLDEATDALVSAAAFGDELPGLSGFMRGKGIAGTVAQTGVGEIVNDVFNDPRRINVVIDVRSLVCAPLKVGEKVIGVIVLASTLPMAYEARELKLLNTLALQTATAIENARLFERTVQAGLERERLLALNHEADVARVRYERELDLAAQIQADLFPAALPDIPGFQIAARSRPARRCGGDYYDALMTPGPAGSTAMLCVADVSGKGLPASLLMANMQATLRALIGRMPSLTDLVKEAHLLLYGSTAANKYVTALLLSLDPRTGRARFVSAGHVNCWHFVPNTPPRVLGSTGAPLGLLPPGLPYEEGVIEIAVGDCVILCSDGIADAQNGAAEEFGEERLAEVVVASIDQPVEEIVERVFAAIDAFAGAAPQFDDITLLVLRRVS